MSVLYFPGPGVFCFRAWAYALDQQNNYSLTMLPPFKMFYDSNKRHARLFDYSGVNTLWTFCDCFQNSE